MGHKTTLTGFVTGKVRQDGNIVAFEMEQPGIQSPPKGLPTSDGVTYTVLCVQKQLSKSNLTPETLGTAKLMIQGEITLDLPRNQCLGDLGLICTQLSILEDKPKGEKQSTSEPKAESKPVQEKKPASKEAEKVLPKYQDKVLHCVDCNTEIVFTAEAQKFNAQRGFVEEPKRCLPCRVIFRQHLREHPEECEQGPITEIDNICVDCGKLFKTAREIPVGKAVLCEKCSKARAEKKKPFAQYRQVPYRIDIPGVEVPLIPVGEEPEGTDGWLLIRHIRVPVGFNRLDPQKTQSALKQVVEKGTLSEPIQVSRDFILVDGWRRLWIAEKMGWDRVPVKWVK